MVRNSFQELLILADASASRVIVTLNDWKDIAEHCVEYGISLGCRYVEARHVRSYTKGFAYRNGQPVSGGASPSEGIGVRVLANGAFGFASFDEASRESAERVITNAHKIAKNSRRKSRIDLGEPITNETKWKTEVKVKLGDIDIYTIMSTATEMNNAMEGIDTSVLTLKLIETDKYLVTSEGTRISSHRSQIGAYIILTAKGESGSEQRFIDMSQVGGWERVKEAQIIEKIHDETERLKQSAERAKKIPELLDAPIDMVVGPEVAGIIAHENVGHPSEGDRILGREGAQAGESFWRDLTFGTSKVGSEIVNVSEDPTIPKTGGFYLYDDEGVKARKRELIKNGIANEPLLNREFGMRFGMGSNAAARASSFNREPISRMANTFFEPGDYSFEELIEDIKFGVYMRSFREWNIDDRRYQSKYTGTEAYLIKKGEITDTMVKRPVIETTSVGLLSAIDAVSKPLRLDFPATCGKGDPMQGVPVYAGGGDIRFRNIRLGGIG